MIKVLSVILKSISNLNTITYEEDKVLKILYAKTKADNNLSNIIFYCINYSNAKTRKEKIFLQDKIQRELLVFKQQQSSVEKC